MMKDDDDRVPPHVAATKEEIVAAIEELKDRYERGELRVAALRLYNKDGTYEDTVLGGDTDEERAAMLAKLQRQIRDGMH